MTEQMTPEHPGEAKQTRPAWLVWAVAGALLVGGIAAAFVVLSSSDDGTTTTADAGALDPDLVLELQTLCFESDPPLFYDDQGFCYPVDPSTLSGDDLIAARVLPNGAVPDENEAALDDSGSDAPVAPSSDSPDGPAAPATTAAPVTTASPAGTSAPTTAPPGTTAAPATTSSTTSTTTTSTTTTAATLPPVNIDQTNWVWNLAAPSSINGVPCEPDPDNGDQYPPGCWDATVGNYNVFFGVANGTVSGAQSVSGLDGKTATFSGSISESGTASINVLVGNLGNWSLNGSMTGNCSITGSYFHDLDQTAGSFTLSTC